MYSNMYQRCVKYVFKRHKYVLKIHKNVLYVHKYVLEICNITHNIYCTFTGNTLNTILKIGDTSNKNT
jgi:hypothetical protein